MKLRSLFRALVTRRAALLIALALLVSTGLAACGGGSGGAALSPNGTVFVTLGSAESREIRHFFVTVSDARVVRDTGASFPLIRRPVTIDLANLDGTAELLGLREVPEGSYPSVRIELDFMNAQVILAGQATAATLLDETGAPLMGTQVLEAVFDARRTLAIGRSERHMAELELDIPATMIVDPSANTVQVSPTLVAVANPISPKRMSLPGSLDTVDPTNFFFTITLQGPGAGLPDGPYRMPTNGATVFQVDGLSSFGVAGLSVLNGKTSGLPLHVTASIDSSNRQFVALLVEGGVGTTRQPADDLARGWIVSRNVNGNTLELGLTAAIVDEGTGRSFNQSLTAIIDTTRTRLVADRSALAPKPSELEVGAPVTVFGRYSATAGTISANQLFDIVRLRTSIYYGTAAGPVANDMLTMDLDSVGPVPVSAFQFTSPRDPSQLLVSTINAGISPGIVAGTPIEIDGAFLEAGSATDAIAFTMKNRAIERSRFAVRYASNQVDPFMTSSATELVFRTTNPALPGANRPTNFADLDQGFVGRGALATSPAPGIEPHPTGIVVVLQTPNRRNLVYTDFNDFTSILNGQLAAGFLFQRLLGTGDYDAANNRLRARRLIVILR